MKPCSLPALDLRGAFLPAVPVPLTAAGTLDEAAQRKYAAYLAAQPISGVAVWVHTGRGLHLDAPTRRVILDIWREALPPPRLVVAGAGGPTAAAVEMAAEAARGGADGLLCYAPAHLRDHPRRDQEIVAYHRAIGETGLPLILFYLYEAAGGIAYSSANLAELLELPQVAGIKLATLDSVMTYQDIQRLVAHSFPGTTLLTGEDRFLPYSIQRGAQGALIGMAAACPAPQAALLTSWLEGDLARFHRLAPAIERFAEVTFRAPMEGYIARMLRALVALGVIPAAAAHDPWGPPLEATDLAEVETAARELECLASPSPVDGL
jgi:4-hydroxy-tetrahydrodipicolinate synthase